MKLTKKRAVLVIALLLAGATVAEACGRIRQRIAERRATRLNANGGGCGDAPSPEYSPPIGGDPEPAKVKTVRYEQRCVNGRCYLVPIN